MRQISQTLRMTGLASACRPLVAARVLSRHPRGLGDVARRHVSPRRALGCLRGSGDAPGRRARAFRGRTRPRGSARARHARGDARAVAPFVPARALERRDRPQQRGRAARLDGGGETRDVGHARAPPRAGSRARQRRCLFVRARHPIGIGAPPRRGLEHERRRRRRRVPERRRPG